MLWVDKYRPHSLDKLELHPGVTERLKKLILCNDFPHVMLYGPSGAGKATRISALLRELYGPGADKVKVSLKSFKTASGKNIEINVIGSNYHIELNPSDLGNDDRYVIQEVITEIAQTHNVNVGAAGANSARSFKVIVLREVDRLSKGAQQALRRTMEKYTSTCRVVLCCESSCSVIAPIRSRVLPIRLPKPSLQEIAAVLGAVARKEGFALPQEFALRVAEAAERNVRRALLMLEASKVDRYPFTADQEVRLPDWERFIDDMGRIICEEQSASRLLLVRNKFYELLVNCIPPSLIIRQLTVVLLKRLDDQLKHKLAALAAFYEHRMQLGSKPIFHLEAFVAKFMAVYKRWVAETFA